MSSKMHIKITGINGEVVVDEDFTCLMGALCIGEGKHMQLYNGCCTNGTKLTTFLAYVENLRRVCDDILDEAPFMRVILEKIIAGKADEVGIFKGTPGANL